MKKASLCVVLILLALLGRADEGQDLMDQMVAAGNVAQAREVVKKHTGYLGRGYAKLASDELSDHSPQDLLGLNTREVLLSIAAAARAHHRPAPGQVADPKAAVRKALAQAGFRDPGRLTAKNWAGRGLDKIWEWIAEQIRKARPRRRPPGGGLISLDALTPIVWGLIVSAVAVFLFLALRHFRLARRRAEARAGGLLEDDEPERTADEWLARADELEARGEHRLAVRCLYVASLVRLDEANVARFRPGETNWEHLHRIQASPRLPAGLEFRPPTERFDRVWYGHRVEGAADVQRFRDWYQATLDALRRRPG